MKIFVTCVCKFIGFHVRGERTRGLRRTSVLVSLSRQEQTVSVCPSADAIGFLVGCSSEAPQYPEECQE